MQASGALRGVRRGAAHVEGGAERFFRDGRPLSFSWASLSSGGPTFLSRVGRMNGFFGEFAEFPEDDYSQDPGWIVFRQILGPQHFVILVNFWLSKIRKIDVERGCMPFCSWATR